MQRLNKKGLLSEGKLAYDATFSKVHLEADNWVLNPCLQGLMDVLEIKNQKSWTFGLSKRSRQVFRKGFSKLIVLWCDGAGSLPERDFSIVPCKVDGAKQFAFLSSTSHWSRPAFVCVCINMCGYIWVCLCVHVSIYIYMYIYIYKKECAKTSNLQKAGKYLCVTIIKQLAVMDLISQEVTKKGYGRIEQERQRGGLLRGILKNAMPGFLAPSLTAWLVWQRSTRWSVKKVSCRRE